jgi:hypothetical protein
MQKSADVEREGDPRVSHKLSSPDVSSTPWAGMDTSLPVLREQLRRLVRATYRVSYRTVGDRFKDQRAGTRGRAIK